MLKKGTLGGKMDYPFEERELKENVVVRKFVQSVDSEELVWHRDRENRLVEVIQSDGWQIQLDNEVPKVLKQGDTVYIKKEFWHRVIKGKGDLVVKITKE